MLLFKLFERINKNSKANQVSLINQSWSQWILKTIIIIIIIMKSNKRIYPSILYGDNTFEEVQY